MAILIILLKPGFLGVIPTLNSIFNFACVAIAVFLTVYSVFMIKITKKYAWILIYYSVIFVSTVINNGNLVAFLKENIYGYALCLLFAICMDKNIEVCLKSFRIANAYIFINFFTVLMFPKGMYTTTLYSQNWFLGYKNPQIRMILAFLCISFLCSVITTHRIGVFNILLFGLAVITALRVSSANGIIGLMIWSVLIILAVYIPKSYKFLNLFTALVAYIMFMLFLMFVSIPDFVYDFLEQINKSNSFLGRYQLWKRIVDCIKNRFLLGYGYLSGLDFTYYSKKRWATHSHNWMLNVMMMGGIVLLMVFLFAVIVSINSLNNSYLFCRIISATLICFFIMGIDEAMTNTTMIYPIFILAMDPEKILAVCKKYEKNEAIQPRIRVSLR